LVWCGLDAEMANVIVASLSCSTLTFLNLRYNKDIGSRGAQALSEMLCVSTSLKSVFLYRCSIGDEGAGHFAVALKRNTGLEVLWLGDNSITYLGAAALAVALPFKKTLKYLQLSENPLGDDGIEALAKAVPRSGLCCLWLADTGFGVKGCAILVEMLKNWSRLRLLGTSTEHWPVLEEGFRCNGWLLLSAPEQYLERNKTMHLRARKSAYALLLIRKLRRTALSSFPKEVVREVAQFVYSTRGEIEAWDLKVARQEQRPGCLCF
jgi:hypothetical protein